MLAIMRTCTHIIPSCMARIIVIVVRPDTDGKWVPDEDPDKDTGLVSL